MKANFKIMLVLVCILYAQFNITNAQTIGKKYNPTQIPYLRDFGNHAQLIVDGKPFLMLGGELHNSSSSSIAYFNDAVDKARLLHINAFIASVSWEQFEPQEGKYDYTLIDAMIKKAFESKLKMVVIWFGSWKNGSSSYVPIWVKEDTSRFFTVKDNKGNNLIREGLNVTSISPFCKAAMNADAKAFTALMDRIKKVDIHQSVIMMQPENEVGSFTDIDHNDIALSMFKSQVPTQLMQYLIDNKKKLGKEINEAWQKKGYKKNGTWSEVFGEQQLDAQNFFMTWQYASYINEVCKQGKKAYQIPMYVNCWLVQNDKELPGSYPNGGPVSRVIDVYRAAAPDIDFVAPDIYLPNYKEILSMYQLPMKKNSLFIPECERTNPGKAYYAFAEHDALGFGPFGIESVASDISYAQSYAVLNELLPTILKYQGTGKMQGILKENDEELAELKMGKFKFLIQFESKVTKAYGLIIQTSEDEFLVAGIGFKLSVTSVDGIAKVAIGQVMEGEFKNSKWNSYRMLNGDETWHNAYLFAIGRSYTVSENNGKITVKQALAPIPVLNQSLEIRLQVEQIKAPGIYKIKLYQAN